MVGKGSLNRDRVEIVAAFLEIRRRRALVGKGSLNRDWVEIVAAFLEILDSL